jgi:predicted ATPase/DNA-binding SARP family transcriptional activator
MLNEPWRIRLLGGLSAAQGAQEITRFRTRQTAELLAYLALHAGADLPRERLMDVLWPDAGLDAARNSLSVALSSLRRQLEPPATPGTPPEGAVLVADRSVVRLRPGTFTTDAAEFEAALRAATAAGDDEEAVLKHLRTADCLYTGELLPGFDAEWVFTERERLADARRGALLRLADLLLPRGEADRAVGCARRAVEADPYDEAARRVLMRALAASGRPAAVAEHFREFERLLDADGDEPSSALRELAARLAEGVDKASGPGPAPKRVLLSREIADSGQNAEPRPVADPLPPSRLPAPLTRFFGREEEIGRTVAALRDGHARLVTLTGMGGTGKTRLAVEAARRWAAEERGAAVFVALADLAQASALFAACRDALGLPRSADGDPREQVVKHLRGTAHPVLLVLDNLEQILGRGPLDPAGAAAAVRALLADAPGLRVLATSREPLALDGEEVLAVPPLPVPPDPRSPADALLTYPSIPLFVDRARSRRVDFQLTPRNAESVARLCARLEGLPLAVELAAARTKLFSPAQILERLEAGFAELETKRPDVPARQRSLRAAVAWSYDLLSPEARRVFAGLSVFRGGFTAEAAAAVCGAEGTGEGAMLETLARLRDAGLLLAEEVPAGAGATETRLRLLEPLREFAAEQVGAEEREALERRHSAFFAGFAQRIREELRDGGAQDRLFDLLEAERENLRAVVYRPGAAQEALGIVGRLTTFWTVRGYLREGTEWLRHALAEDDARGAPPTIERGWTLHTAGNIACERGDMGEALRLYEECAAIYRQLGFTRGEASLQLQLGNIAHSRNDFAAARRHYEARLAHVREHGPPNEVAYALGSLGSVAQTEGDLAGARAMMEEARTILEAEGDAQAAAIIVHNLALLALSEGDLARSRALHEEALHRKSDLGFRQGVAFVLTTLAKLDLSEGDADAACARLTEAIAIGEELGIPRRVIECVEAFARHAAQTGQPERAARLWGAADALASAHDMNFDPSEAREIAGMTEASRRAAPSPERFDTARREGAGLSLEEAARLALGVTGAA